MTQEQITSISEAIKTNTAGQAMAAYFKEAAMVLPYEVAGSIDSRVVYNNNIESINPNSPMNNKTLNQPQQSRSQIICDYQNDNRGRQWDIEVQMASNAFGRNVRVKCTSGDIRKTIETLSAAFPGEETRVAALGCLRAIFIDGELAEDFIHFGDRFEDANDRYTWESFQEFARKER